ncbi:uncharacterized protein KY384_007897 [Bacidia gigantensis]|uniref:uncharacterized protein n=1 Tax=Bacidia gigantensis TaxID=2732470 RepID=UPI001D055F7E|nr:uncharacterized protein KY384_007897 [Bacidia gigantensis]KAG8527743.1 hypothetical protein KY384_007897 [Bacidia gigantensis]
MPTLTVRPLDGSNLTFPNISFAILVAQLKQLIAERQGVQPRDQRLIYGGQYLDDQRTLESYNIGDGFVIRLLTAAPSPSPANLPQAGSVGPRVLRNIFVQPATGPVISIRDVPADATVEHLKQMYFYRTDQNPEFVRMIYGGKEIEEIRGVGVCDILLLFVVLRKGKGGMRGGVCGGWGGMVVNGKGEKGQ